MDFILKIYSQLLETFLTHGYQFQTLEYYISKSEKKVVILRHDVDRKPQNALRMAILENELGIKATYYFGTIRQTFKPEIIKEIADLGNEIAYHYECLAETNGDYEKAIEGFQINLKKLRQYYPVNTIAMHGRPTSKWDSRLLWGKYDYRKYGIIAEPYFDIDFNEVLYITDTGRAWYNESINRRDKVNTKYNFNICHTNEIIETLNNGNFPYKIMINIHPEHWAETKFEWYRIYLNRKLRNTVKRIVIRNK